MTMIVLYNGASVSGLTLQDNKDKKLRVFDPRAGSCTGVSSCSTVYQKSGTLCCICVCVCVTGS